MLDRLLVRCLGHKWSVMLADIGDTFFDDPNEHAARGCAAGAGIMFGYRLFIGAVAHVEVCVVNKLRRAKQNPHFVKISWFG